MIGAQRSDVSMNTDKKMRAFARYN